MIGKPEMESRSTSAVLRRTRPLAGSYRHYPYSTGTVSTNTDKKEEVVQLGVELSLYVAQLMFLLCDDIRTMLEFCFKMWKCVLPYPNPVLERLLRVFHYVYSKDIKPKNGVYHDGGDSVQWELISTTWNHFADGIIILHRLDMVLRRKVGSFDDRQLSSVIEKYKQEVLKNLEDKLRSAKNVSEANGFAKETIESNIFCLWKSLFDEEEMSEVIKNRILIDLFTPLFGKQMRSEILALPVCSPYILGKDFELQEVKEEVVRLLVELSLYVAESMFLLCDDIRTMLWFLKRVWRDAKRGAINESHVMDRLLRVMHYVYTKYIKPKNGVYQNDGYNSVQWELIRTILDNLALEFISLNCLVHFLISGGECSRKFTSRMEERVKNVWEKMGCVKAVSDANGFARDAMESDISELWRSLFDREVKEATQTLETIKNEIIRDLFLPLSNEAPPAWY